MTSSGKSLEERIEMPSIPAKIASQLSRIEQEITRAEVEQFRKSVPIFRSLFEKRNEIITSPEIEGDFWIRVFSNAPSQIDEYILPSDAAALGSSLKNLKVERFEVDENGQGEPRSIRFIFEFKTGEENPYFENETLVKDFYWRKQVSIGSKGKRKTWEGLVSEPVRIDWKKDMDLTRGLLDAACDLAEAEKKQAAKDRKDLPEFAKLVKKMEEIENDMMEGEADEDDDEEDLGLQSPAGSSFFAFFGYRGRDVSAEESKEAAKEDDERWAKIAKGEEIEELDQEDESDDDIELDDDDFDDIEIFPDGEEFAVAMAEDLWAGALKYYVKSFEIADDLDDLEDEDEGEDEDEDEDEDESSRPHKRVRV